VIALLKEIDWNRVLPPMPAGSVSLVGAGPGDPLLISLKGMIRLRQASAIVHDALVDRSLLRLASEGTQVIDVGKRAGRHKKSQAEINELLISLARAGGRVVRLKGGDPLVFARGAEEAEALYQAGIDFEIVPAVTAACGAAAYAGIPLTDRRYSSSAVLATGHEAADKDAPSLDHVALARAGTIVLYMTLKRLREQTSALIKAGLPPEMPAAVVSNATWPKQRCVVAPLHRIAEEVHLAGLQPPAVVFIGPTVTLREKACWFERLPLFGRRVAVTRSPQQADELAALLAAHGAEPIPAPTIKICRVPLSDLAATLQHIDEYDWLVLTSVNGVETLVDAMRSLGMDARALSHTKIAAVGPATAASLRRHFLQPDLLPERFTTEALAEAFRTRPDIAGSRVLLFRADLAGSRLTQALQDLGARCTEVTAYRVKLPAALPDKFLKDLRAAAIHWITLTSASTFRNLLALLGQDGYTLLKSVKLASIGPATSQAIRQAGLQPTVEATQHTLAGLVDAMIAYERSLKGPT